MRLSILIIILLSSSALFAQRHSLEGVWQGVIYQQGTKVKDGNALWMEIQVNEKNGTLSGASRVESPYKEYFAYKPLKGKVLSDSSIHFDEVNIRKKKESGQYIWCTNIGDLTYDKETGYLEGKWYSEECKREAGRIILYRSKYELSKTDTNTLYHSWFDNFVGDLRRGWPAYYVRDAEMRNFEFVPVYFDHDMDVLKEGFHDYLKQMVAIVKSHSDLRIKIIGHTDSNGTDAYNIDLSQRRADRVKQFLVDQGLRPDRVVIEFRGERDPATSNATKKGKSLNRRVDFEFI